MTVLRERLICSISVDELGDIGWGFVSYTLDQTEHAKVMLALGITEQEVMV